MFFLSFRFFFFVFVSVFVIVFVFVSRSVGKAFWGPKTGGTRGVAVLRMCFWRRRGEDYRRGEAANSSHFRSIS